MNEKGHKFMTDSGLLSGSAGGGKAEEGDRCRDQVSGISAEQGREWKPEPAVVIQKLLYEHPLYEAVDENVTDVNVLVIGSGKGGQLFIDECLQAGQMSGIHLNITAVSDKPDVDRESYLRPRPAISEFVNVNGSLEGMEDKAFASLAFRNVTEPPYDENKRLRFGGDEQANQELVRNLIESAVLQDKEFHYIFVALGDDRLTEAIARLCSEGLQDWWGRTCPVCYVCRESLEVPAADPAENLYPVYVNEPVDVASIDRRLGEMAFNVHISWKDSLNIDVTAERRDFFEGQTEEDRYNRASSLAYALSIRYKLHSIQIDLDDLQEAAERFSDQILKAKNTDEKARKTFDRMVELEHRRWVIERAVGGWTAPRDKNGRLRLEDCIVRGSVKDTECRTHPCMVRSTATSPLNDRKYSDDHHAKWNEGDIDPDLDELDRMSIELHRCFRKRAQQLRTENLYLNPDLMFIQNQIPIGYDDVERAFKQFRFALKNIVNGVESYSRQYMYYQNALKKTLSVFSPGIRTEIEEHLDVIRHTFFPVIESNLYRNYKANDERLIEKIPFILTYRYMPSIAIAFEDGKYQNGRNETVFANVAAATILSPEKVRFLYCYDRASDIQLLVQKLEAVRNYFGKRNVKSGIRLILACMKDVPEKERNILRKELSKLFDKYQPSDGNAWFEKEIIYEVSDFEEAAEKFEEYLKENPVDMYDGGNPLFHSSYENALFIGRVIGLNIPYFEFDWRNKMFSRRIGCEFLKFVKDASFIRIRDMFALMNANDTQFNLPSLADEYEKLWEIYIGKYLYNNKFENGVSNWNRLCIRLKEYEESQKPLVRIEIRTGKSICCETMTFDLPDYAYPSAKMILQKLMEYGVAGQDSNIKDVVGDTCRLEIRAGKEYESEINKIFADPEILQPELEIEVRRIKSYMADFVEIRCNRLDVVNVDLEDGNRRGQYLYEVLLQLEKKHFISRLKGDRNKPTAVSFVYSSPAIKKLLTTAGEILEVYAYYEVLKTGYFDDVATGYEFSWESGGVKNELDLVLTKGFRSIFIECKAVVELKLDYYHKLDSIADQFGIGTTKILLGNTYRKSNAVAKELNTMQRSRGDQLHIKTISSENNIIHIGRTLKRLMEV